MSSMPTKKDEDNTRFVKPGTRGWFLEIALVYVTVLVCVCVCVCPPLRPLITSGMIWCDIGRVQLVKQVL